MNTLCGLLEVIINFKDENISKIKSDNVSDEELVEKLIICFVSGLSQVLGIDYSKYYNEVEDTKGELEVIVNYLNVGMMKVRSKDTKVAEIPYKVKEIFEVMIKTQKKIESGIIPNNVMKLYGDKQFEGA